MEGCSSARNSEPEERDAELWAVDRLLREDADRFFEGASRRDWLRPQFNRLIERLELEGLEDHEEG